MNLAGGMGFDVVTSCHVTEARVRWQVLVDMEINFPMFHKSARYPDKLRYCYFLKNDFDL
jgi:hypothetical protein